MAGPLLLSFDKKVSFYKKWKFVFPAMLLPALFYISWDVFFTHVHVWSFNADYVCGVNIFNLPLEEVLFFFIVPYCCVFIYECIRCYFPLLKDLSAASLILKVMAVVLFATGIFYFDRNYTGFTFIFTAVFIAIILLLQNYFIHFHRTAFLLSFLISLIPFLLVNGLLTSIPVVLYDDAENLGIRINTIPFEDIFYGMLLIMMNVAGYERLKGKVIISP